MRTTLRSQVWTKSVVARATHQLPSTATNSPGKSVEQPDAKEFATSSENLYDRTSKIAALQRGNITMDTKFEHEETRTARELPDHEIELCDFEPANVPSAVLARLIEEVRNESAPLVQGYNRYDRFHNRHNR
jgi:hypothetical protein